MSTNPPPPATSHAERVSAAFGAWEHGKMGPFFALVAPDVHWRVIGTTALSGTYDSKAAFQAAIVPLVERLAEPIVAKVVAVRQAGDTVILQWEGTSRGVNGRPYRQSYCWVLTFGGAGPDALISDVVAYLDTALIDDMMAD